MARFIGLGRTYRVLGVQTPSLFFNELGSFQAILGYFQSILGNLLGRFGNFRQFLATSGNLAIFGEG